MTIVNADSRVVNKLKTSLTDNARVVIYDRHMFIVQATGWITIQSLPSRASFTNIKLGFLGQTL